MKTTRRLIITIENYELKIARFHKRRRIYCFDCQTETLHFTVSQLAVLLVISEIAIYRLCERKCLHANETIDGKLLICAESIANLGESLNKRI
jgi:hypothetical protein